MTPLVFTWRTKARWFGLPVGPSMWVSLISRLGMIDGLIPTLTGPWTLWKHLMRVFLRLVACTLTYGQRADRPN